MQITSFKLLLLTILAITAMTVGVLALYSHTIMPGLKKTDNATFVKSFKAMDTAIINPVFMLQFSLPLFLFAAALYFNAKHSFVDAKWLIVGFVAYLLAIIITMAVNVPLNDGLKKVADSANNATLEQARQQFNETRWVIGNAARLFLSLIALIATIFAVKDL